MASLHRRDNGRWKVAYRDPDGRQRAKTFRNKRAAERYRITVETEIETGTWRDPAEGRRLFSTFAETWFAEKANAKPGTRNNYRSILDRHVLPAFKDAEIARIRTDQIRRWVAGLRDAGVGETTVHKAFQIMGSILDLALEDGAVLASPMPRKGRPTAPKAHEMRFLTLDELDLLGEAIDPLYRTWLYVMAHTGMRWSEAAGLRVKRVDLMRRRIDIVEQMVDVSGTLTVQTPKTDNGRRTIAIPKWMADLLVIQMAGKAPDELVFTTATGTPLRQANFRKRQWQPAIAEAGIEHLRVHDLRHTHVAILIAQDEKPLAISKRLGHFDPKFTLSRYGHLMPDEDEALADRLEGLGPGARAAATVVDLNREEVEVSA